MPYEEKVAQRVRDVLGERSDIAEKKMFGGIAFLLNGKMAVGVLGDCLVLKLGNDLAEDSLKRKHTRPMDFTGKVIRSMLYVEPAGFRTKAQLASWIDKALEANTASR